jgi:hypothetical protein
MYQYLPEILLRNTATARRHTTGYSQPWERQISLDPTQLAPRVSALSLSFVGVQILNLPPVITLCGTFFLPKWGASTVFCISYDCTCDSPRMFRNWSKPLSAHIWVTRVFNLADGAGVLWLQQLVTQQWRWVSPQTFHFIKPTARPSRFSLTSGLNRRTGCPFCLKYFSRYWIAIRFRTLRLRTWCQTVWKSGRKILQIPPPAAVSTDSPVIYTPLQIIWHMQQDKSLE